MRKIIYILGVFTLNTILLAMWKLVDGNDRWVIPDEVELEYPNITPAAYLWNLGVLLSMCLIWVVMFYTKHFYPFDFFERFEVFLCFLFSGFDVVETIFDLNQKDFNYEWPIFIFFTLVNIGTKLFWESKRQTRWERRLRLQTTEAVK